MQGRIKHDRMELGTADPRADFLKAHKLFPGRAEPLIWLCWHHHKLMNACPQGPGIEACWLRERIAAYHYARLAASLPMPDVSPGKPSLLLCLARSAAIQHEQLQAPAARHDF